MLTRQRAGPNGASMRPNSYMQKELIYSFEGARALVYILPAGGSARVHLSPAEPDNQGPIGVELPDDLVFLHEHSDHFSLQPAKPMALSELNSKITQFLKQHAKAEFEDKFPFMG